MPLRPAASIPVLFVTPPNFVQDESVNIEEFHDLQKMGIVDTAVRAVQILDQHFHLCKSDLNGSTNNLLVFSPRAIF